MITKLKHSRWYERFYTQPKKIISDQESFIFTKEMGPRFYASDFYATLGLHYKMDNFIIRLEGQLAIDIVF